MTDTPNSDDGARVLEAVARAICEATGLRWEDQVSHLTSGGGGENEQEGYREQARAAIKAYRTTLSQPTEKEGEPLERWSDIQGDTDAIVRCGDRWKNVATKIGCGLHGFNDGYSASFITPDGRVIEVGPKFRAAIAALSSPVGSQEKKG